MEGKLVRLAVNGGIGFGAQLSPKQLLLLSKYLPEDSEIELTTFQQLIIQVPEDNLEQIRNELELIGLSCYSVGNYVKSLRTCGFCKGAEEEGMPVAIELNNRIAGKEVPFTLRPAYTGCPTACGEPLVNDIGVIKQRDTFDLYLGGKANGLDARTGQLFKNNLQPNELFKLVEQIIDIYAKNGKRREKFSKFLNRFGIDQIKQQLNI
ncbi:MAG: nitrite reductase [Bacillota bacterium]|uniref:nitrite reductase n=1 Tax=Fictibacillus TaxID=1329200 RepID=UPI0018CC8AF4|nr:MULTISPECIES: nitrite reductase [unclassified Fictibacillus]MBH0157198.1 nitrite reductase [Fictibacillus sp. 5RED26]MBH0159519.1 nitrite reductase [Fictibacillus sp. 26RED30]MBH0163681.1 nitrite reductase [Fictibacillus sp. 7GRE50]MBH0169692.1 nitrite reductase [Fictibacillus sp. 18YEL24]MBH0174192.1 nitrite reductase [Fictibacillus sp. 23RED33]